MASMNMQRADLPWIYDVFLSFRGEDTRNTFTGHLYSALDDKGIFTFKDNQRLERGKVISVELLKAIEESRFSVIVFSENYAFSTWCLDELAKILQCMKERGQRVFPIFYHVNPSDVRKQTGSFEKAFVEHEKNFREDLEKVQKWRVAMTEIGKLSGWHLQDREESKFVKGIVDKISSKLSHPISFNTTLGNVVGMDSRLKQIDSLIDIDLNDVRMVGIYGMGGIGKTTIARLFFDKNFNLFDGSIFLANVREVSMTQGLVALQQKLFSVILREKNMNMWDDHIVTIEIRRRLQNKRVLVVLDDVDELEQLQALAGMHNWFGSGSRIIITTRNRRLLSTHGVDYGYRVDGLNHVEALQLFCWKAFRNSHPSYDYVDLSSQMINYADGLPLALEVLGSFLFGRSIAEWKDALDRLKKMPDGKIFAVLKISYDGLQELEKKIFLDIACFFKGWKKDEVREILDSCDFNPDIGISVLIDKCIITLSNNMLYMHDLIQDTGKEIVRQQCAENPGQRSRLWLSCDIYRVLAENEGTEVVEGIIQEFPTNTELKLNAKSFSRMKNLRFLKIKDVSLGQGLEYLSNELRLLNWHGYPLISLPSNFQYNKLFELNMCSSHVKELWKGIQHMNHLKTVILSDSIYLTKTPDFTGVPNLEKLILGGCKRLSFVHPSIGLLKRLIFLDLKDCKQLRSLRTETECKSLKILILSGCSKLIDFQGIVASAKHLFQLSLDGTSIKELPSIQHLTRLQVLNINGCSKLQKLPEDLGHSITRLQVLDLSGCSKLQKLPEDLGHAMSLNSLVLDGTAIRELPTSISLLKNLQKLSLQGCKGQPSQSLSPLSLFSRFRRANLSDSMGLRLPSFSGLRSLNELILRDCNIQEGAIPSDLGYLPSLCKLDLSSNNFVSLPASLSQLPELKILFMNHCSQLQALPVLPARITELHAANCTSLERVSSSPSHLFTSRLQLFHLTNCFKLPGDQGTNSVMVAFFKNVLQSLFQGDMPGYCASAEFNIIVPGARVPEWFHYQSIGPSTSILPPIDISRNTFRGLAICAAFSIHHRGVFSGQALYPDHDSSEFFRHLDTLKFGCILKMGVCKFYVPVSLPTNLMANSVHLWMCYVSKPYSENKFLPEGHSSIHALFEVWKHPNIALEVKACGLRPVFGSDLEEFVQASRNPSNSTRFEELDRDDLAATSTIIKRSRDDNCPDQQPRGKRLR